MLTIDVEKELKKKQVKLVTPVNLLALQEFEKIANLDKEINIEDVLRRSKLDTAFTRGKSVQNKLNSELNKISKFNKDKVYHIDQIEEICNKYYLKFLPSKMYKGNLDEKVPYKILTFESTYDIKVDSDYSCKLYIIAPAESFELMDKPKDPLLFYKITDDHYYLIHKWGNDLSIINRIKPFLSTWLGSFLAYTSLCMTILCIAPFILYHFYPNNTWLWIKWITFAISIVLSFAVVSCSDENGEYTRWLPENDFRKEFKD